MTWYFDYRASARFWEMVIPEYYEDRWQEDQCMLIKRFIILFYNTFYFIVTHLYGDKFVQR